MKFSPRSLVQSIVQNKKTILLIVLVSALTLLISNAISTWFSSYHNSSFPSFGKIRVIGVEVYGGNILTSQDGERYLDWGKVYPGTVVTRSFYVKCTSNMPVTLNLAISNIIFKNSQGQNVTRTPPINQPLSITWNYNGAVLKPSESIYITLTLNASSDINFLIYTLDNDIKEFAFDIAIKASPAE
ncbi:MAG: hypothetical protein QXZ70_09015 [Candidatus Bathyarchaeia archaeon]